MTLFNSSLFSKSLLEYYNKNNMFMLSQMGSTSTGKKVYVNDGG